MNYTLIYAKFIESRVASQSSLFDSGKYIERHHILPRSLGGSDDAQNLVMLTAREHYFAHCCLAKIHGGKMWSALFAVSAMCKVDKASSYFLKARMVSIARQKAALVRSENMTALWASGEFSRNRTYQPHPDAVKERIRQALVGRRSSPESIAKSLATRAKSSKRFCFVNLETQEEFSGTQAEFCRFSGVEQPLASALTRKRIKVANVWALKGVDVRSVRGRDPVVRKFEHALGEVFVGTAYEFRIAYQLDPGTVWKLVKGNTAVKSFKGWKYVGACEGHTASG